MSAADPAPGKQRGRPWPRGKSGNPAGRPKGLRNRATRLAEALLAGEAEALARKAVELALGGDVTALRICLERLVPPCRDRAVKFTLPPLDAATDAPKVLAAVAAAMADGELTPSEARDVAAMVESWRKAIESADLEARVRALEDRGENRR